MHSVVGSPTRPSECAAVVVLPDVLACAAVAVFQGLVLHEDLKARMRVLRRLGYIDSGEPGCSAHSRGFRLCCAASLLSIDVLCTVTTPALAHHATMHCPSLPATLRVSF